MTSLYSNYIKVMRQARATLAAMDITPALQNALGRALDGLNENEHADQYILRMLRAGDTDKAVGVLMWFAAAYNKTATESSFRFMRKKILPHIQAEMKELASRANIVTISKGE